MTKPRTDGLELPQDLQFERRSWRGERVAWVLLALLVVAGLAGLLGSGPLSRASAGEEGSALRLEYQRFIRHSAYETLRIQLGPGSTQAGLARVWISGEYLKHVKLELMTPPPARVEIGPERLVYAFLVSDPGRSAAIAVRVQPERVGRLHGAVGLMDGPTLDFVQFVYP